MPPRMASIQTYVPDSIKPLAELLDIPYTQDLQEEFNTLVKTILKETISDKPQDENPGPLSDPVVNKIPLEQENKRVKITQQFFIMQQENFFCNYKSSDPVHFWSVVLQKFPITIQLEKLIKSAIIIPLGSADAERSFSQLNLIKAGFTNDVQM